MFKDMDNATKRLFILFAFAALITVVCVIADCQQKVASMQYSRDVNVAEHETHQDNNQGKEFRFGCAR